MTVQRVGTVVRTAGGVAIARAEPGVDPPAIGAGVIDESLSRVGRVVDVFGPVSHPYIAISPDDATALTSLVGGPLYAR